MRVLFAYRDDVDTKGGAATVMHRTAEALERLGVDVEITYSLDPDTTGFDVVHPVNVWQPSTALDQLRNLRARNATVVWQPFYLGYSELSWAMRAVAAVFDPARPPSEREQLMQAWVAGALEVDGMSRFGRNEPVPGFHEAMREMLDLVDRLVVCSMHEAQLISQDVGLRGVPFSHTPHGVQAERFVDADPASFRAHAGLGQEPFVLCVGALDARKNQAMLAHALRHLDVPVVLLGPALEPAYRERVMTAGGDRLVHIDRVPPELVASAYHGAAVHVLPSWAEGAALANLEAAAAGCPVIVSDRSSEFEYFGNLARYCDPASSASIREAVEQALDTRKHEPERIAALQERLQPLTWEKTARASLEAYEAAIADRAKRAAGESAVVAPRRPPVSDRLRQFTDGLPWVRRPILEFVQEVAEGLEAGSRVFDVGSGDSPYRELFEHCDYVTNDWTHSVHPGARAVDVVGPAHDLPVDDESFDVVLLTEVLEHTPNPGEVLAELYRVLRPGGVLHMTTPFAWELHELPFDFYRYTPWALDRLARQGGFDATDIAPRNDTFATLAQLMADIVTKIGSYPDGRDGERAAAIEELRGVAHRVGRLGHLDARRSMPLGYRVSAWKAPLPERERGQGIDGARSFATLAYAGELLFDPALLRAYGERFGGDDDATLVIYAPHSHAGEVEPRLLQLAAAAGLAGEGSADLLALPYPGAAPDEAALAAGVDAVLSHNPPRGAFRFVPHYHRATVSGLHAAAEQAGSARTA